jgi:hypothetical protein
LKFYLKLYLVRMIELIFLITIASILSVHIALHYKDNLFLLIFMPAVIPLVVLAFNILMTSLWFDKMYYKRLLKSHTQSQIEELMAENKSKNELINKNINKVIERVEELIPNKLIQNKLDDYKKNETLRKKELKCKIHKYFTLRPDNIPKKIILILKRFLITLNVIAIGWSLYQMYDGNYDFEEMFSFIFIFSLSSYGIVILLLWNIEAVMSRDNEER